jgi:VWFA-related protein
MNRFYTGFSISILICGLTCLGAFGVATQTKPAEIPEEKKIKVQTDLMEVRAVVTDRKGTIIENLKHEDFELLENGKPQEISFFSVSKVEREQGRPDVKTELPTGQIAEPQPSTLQRLTEAPVRTILLYADTLHLSFSSFNAVKDALRRYVDEKLTDQDMVALATSGSTLGIAQQFTRDKQLLRYAIEQIRVGTYSKDSLFKPQLASDVLLRNKEALRLAVDIVRREDGIICCGPALLYAFDKARQVLSEADFSRKMTLSVLRDFSAQMINLPGKHMIVVFSDGFSMFNSSGSIQNDELQSAVSRAVRSGVTIYSIEARGLQGPPTIGADRTPPSPSPLSYECPEKPDNDAPACAPPEMEYLATWVHMAEREEQNGLNTIAVETGGKRFSDTNNLGEALGRALEANRFHYVLSYHLPASADSRGFRSIKVRVRNHPEYTVRTVRGFHSADLVLKVEDAAGKTPQQRLLQAMEAPLPKTDLGVSARAEFLQTEMDDRHVSLNVYFDGDRFQYREQDQRNVVTLEILYVILDAAGKQVDAISANVEGNLSQERVAQAKTSGYRFSQRLTLKPGVYQARIGVREEGTDRMGTAMTWISVPEIKPTGLEMSDLLLRNPLDTDPAVKEGMEIGELEQIRMMHSIPLYARNDFCDYSFRIHPGTLPLKNTSLVWRMEVLQDGKPLGQEQWQPIADEDRVLDSKGWFDLDGDVELDAFKPGVYELRVSVKEAGSDKTVQRTTVFAIE